MRFNSSRRALLGTGVTLVVLAPIVAHAQSAPPEVEVYKSSTCGCCKDWIKHLEANGFKVTATDVPDPNNWRSRLGMPAKYGSCHTAVVGRYVVEGHVPAAEIKRLLREKPTALGIAVPGMPVGSPGMDGPEYKGRKDNYNVMLVDKDGAARVWASY